MSARVIVSGALGKPPEIRTSKNGNQFATCSLRESLNGSTRWWQGIAFNESVIETLKEMAVGEPLAVAGEFTAETYAPAGADARVSLRIVVDAVLSARKPKQKPTPEKSFKQRGRERLLPELEDALNESVSAADSGRRTAERSWAAPTRAAVETPHVKKGTDFDDSIPF
jgi:single-stranded DNA-binding protein